jgi:penicillin-binding protein 2
MSWNSNDKYEYDCFVEKYKNLMLVFIFLFVILSARLFYLQIIKGNYYKNISDTQRLNRTHEKASRGLIYDTNGHTLVTNNTNYVVLFYPFEQQNEPTEESIKKLSEILKKDITHSIEKSWRYGRVVKLAENLTKEEVFKIQENRLFLPGIYVVKDPKRVCYYPIENAHIIGYVNEIKLEEIDNIEDTDLKVGDIIGRCGIEQYYDKYLRGKAGGFSFEVNARGRYNKTFSYEKPVTGNDLYLTIDSKLQTVAYEALKNSSSGKGAAVAIDVKTGAIKCMVSCPSYDLNKISSPKDYRNYLKDKKLPFFNRCIQALYPPGSIFKIITFIAALDYLHYNPNTIQYCTGYFELGNRVYACSSRAGHKKINLISAMAYSCNTYFYILGLDLGVRVIVDYAKKLRLGEKTGVDIASEKKGFIPTPEWKKSKMKMAWLKGDTAILAIGQGALWVTPLQMANLTATIANRGISYKPYLVDRITDSSTKKIIFKHEPVENEKIELDQYIWEQLNKAMEAVVDYGSAKRTKFRNIKVAAKTGTAENPHGEDHAWVVAYAPSDNPKLALAVIVENGGFGGKNSVPIAREIFKQYFNIIDTPEDEELVYGKNNIKH